MKTKGQIEDTLAKEATKFYVTTLGVGPRETRAYILQDLIIIRLKSKLLPIEEKLLEGNHGVELVKNIRKSLHEITTNGMEEIIKKCTGQTVISSHSDVSTKTGEIMYVFVIDINFEKELQKS
jgi:uncharacterized protein YbcI